MKPIKDGRPHRAVVSQFIAHPRLMLSALIGVATYLLAGPQYGEAARLLIGWNIGALCFLAMMLQMMSRSTGDVMRARAVRTDEGRFFVLSLSLIAVVVSLAAIVMELSQIKTPDSENWLLHVALAVLTIFVSWAFIQAIFTEHYAHEFYMHWQDGRRMPNSEGGGLGFPKDTKPDYIDFLYFTVTISVANQTADVMIESRPMRIVVLVHSVIAYFFNAAVLALSINILSNSV
ncbi:DUF1345 domain-containing protein [Rhizobium alvei]|uniref:DUF1345 domain-containing protein n=1 Tax=Rhizobium alvei TaxID=1132659 RepID=A0ABT8YNG2_9HYPH|nr:DUF1345 domain-containing protein [Rhizobium alvei]MDO6965266.1 DUF1345 domain-containing protein [Rhizobium alvei]